MGVFGHLVLTMNGVPDNGGVARNRSDPRCPLRPEDPCTLCQVNVTGPQDCGLVYLMMSDDELREFRTQNLRKSKAERPPN